MLLGVWLSLLEPTPIWAFLPSSLPFSKVPGKSWSFLCWPGEQRCWQFFRKGCHTGTGGRVRRIQDMRGLSAVAAENRGLGVWD